MNATTLADLNANAGTRENFMGYTLEFRWAVGRNGKSYRGQTGTKLHLLRTEVVVAEKGEHVPGTYVVGATFSVGGACGSNGQHTGVVVKGKDLADVTCEKCLKVLARMSAALVTP